ncbi:MAG: hypothetical protein GDA46_02905 [Bdellovibrionales bacterium]|nr:hypothetical protein [Bdellovibrionales bacterium]
MKNFIFCFSLRRDKKPLFKSDLKIGIVELREKHRILNESQVLNKIIQRRFLEMVYLIKEIYSKQEL